jgi:hypothetical protein
MFAIGVGSPSALDNADFIIPGFESFRLPDLEQIWSN